MNLPEKAPFHSMGIFENSFADNYGALVIASRYSSYKKPDRVFRGIWPHGVNPPWYMHSPSKLFNVFPGVEDWLVLMTRKEEASFLSSNGFKNVRAIGCPFIYSEKENIERKKDTLVVLPVHSLIGFQIDDRFAFDQYAKEISSLSHLFKRIVICLHRSCIQNGIWLKEFERYGFQIIQGADPDDANSYRRMRRIFSTFEFMTTNDFGSHIPYALACGSKVSIFGKKIDWGVENLKRDLFYTKNIGNLNFFRSTEFKNKENDYLKKFYVDPRDGISDADLGNWFVGLDNKVSPKEMYLILKEGFKETILDQFKKIAKKFPYARSLYGIFRQNKA